MELLSDKSRRSISNRMSVHHSNRHHFQTCVSDKTFVCLTDCVNSEMSFVNRDVHFLSETDDNVAGIPSSKPHASAGVQSLPARTKKRLLTVHSVRCDSQLSRMLSKTPAAIASRLAIILFKKLVALI